MKLEDYLYLLRKAQEIKMSSQDLTQEFGIADNWAILLNCDFNKIVCDFFRNGTYVFNNSLNDYDLEKEVSFISKDGIDVKFIVEPNTGFISNGVYGSKESEDVLKNYNVGLILNPYHCEWDNGRFNIKAMLPTIIDISEYILKQKLPCCFGKSIGKKYYIWNGEKQDFDYLLPVEQLKEMVVFNTL